MTCALDLRRWARNLPCPPALLFVTSAGLHSEPGDQLRVSVTGLTPSPSCPATRLHVPFCTASPGPRRILRRLKVTPVPSQPIRAAVIVLLFRLIIPRPSRPHGGIGRSLNPATLSPLRLIWPPGFFLPCFRARGRGTGEGVRSAPLPPRGDSPLTGSRDVRDPQRPARLKGREFTLAVLA